MVAGRLTIAVMKSGCQQYQWISTATSASLGVRALLGQKKSFSSRTPKPRQPERATRLVLCKGRESQQTLLEDTRPYVLSKEDLSTNRTQIIPKILHQVYLGWDHQPMPAHWKEPQQSCRNLNPEFEYKFWTNETAYELLQREYPWFLDTWNNYRYPIERADSIRYFILEHYGGIYVDLDNGCQRNLSPLLAYAAWMPGTTNHLGLTQHVMGTRPQHPYFRLLIESLNAYDHNWLLPYLTIMNSAGPHFVSMVWSTYLSSTHIATTTPNEHGYDEVRILAQEEYAGHAWSFFTKEAGGTWHHWDTAVFKWIGHHIVFFVSACFLTLCVLSFGLWWCVCALVGMWWRQRTSKKLMRRTGTYSPLDEGELGQSLLAYGKAD